MADHIDEILEDYFCGNIDKWIDARIHQLTFQEKMDNLGIKSQPTGQSPQESELIRKQELDHKIENDRDILRWQEQKYWIEYWLPSFPEVKKIYKLYFENQENFQFVAIDMSYHDKTIYNRRQEFKKTLSTWLP